MSCWLQEHVRKTAPSISSDEKIWQWSTLPKIHKRVSGEVIQLISDVSEMYGGSDIFPCSWWRKSDYLMCSEQDRVLIGPAVNHVNRLKCVSILSKWQTKVKRFKQNTQNPLGELIFYVIYLIYVVNLVITKRRG